MHVNKTMSLAVPGTDARLTVAVDNGVEVMLRKELTKLGKQKVEWHKQMQKGNHKGRRKANYLRLQIIGTNHRIHAICPEWESDNPPQLR